MVLFLSCLERLRTIGNLDFLLLEMVFCTWGRGIRAIVIHEISPLKNSHRQILIHKSSTQSHPVPAPILYFPCNCHAHSKVGF